MAFLFDTDAISESLKRQPLATYLAWLAGVPREDQFVSAVTIGELFYGAYRSASPRHLQNIQHLVLPQLTVLSYDAQIARRFGMVRAELEGRGAVLGHADAQIAATALHHGLELVTGNLRHFRRIGGLRISPILDDARRGGP